MTTNAQIALRIRQLRAFLDQCAQGDDPPYAHRDRAAVHLAHLRALIASRHTERSLQSARSRPAPPA
jgi:hypothetical protein